MPTLYLSAPYNRNQSDVSSYRDFRKILQDGKGPDYAIYSTLIERIVPGMKVVVFDRTRQLQAEGVVSRLEQRPGNRVARYHVYLRDLTEVSYTHPPRVNRCGVEVR